MLVLTGEEETGLDHKTEPEADIQPWTLCKLEVTFKDVTLNVISKLKYTLAALVAIRYQPSIHVLQ